MSTRFMTITIFLMLCVNFTYASSWDEVDSKIHADQCNIIKDRIRSSQFVLDKTYTKATGKASLRKIDYTIKNLDSYVANDCLISKNDKEFYNKEVIYWGTQKYKVKKILREDVKRPSWSADEAIKIEKQREKIAKKPKPKFTKDIQANALATSAFPQENNSSSATSISSEIISRLYGSEFDTYSQTQKKFIKKHLGTIYSITQRTLSINGYPDISVRTGQQGTNIVSFYLHPNGDISNLRLKRDIGYQALDQNTLDVVRMAYKDYPLPSKKTRIIFHVSYTLY